MEFIWDGPNLDIRPITDEGRVLGEVNAVLAEAFERIADANVQEIAPELQEAADRLVRAHALVKPLFAIGRIAPHRRAANAPEYAEILARLAMAEVAFVAQLARLRSGWLFRSSRAPSGPMTGDR